MDLQCLESALYREITRPTNVACFRDRASAYPALTPFDSPAVVVAELAKRRCYEFAEPVTRDLIAASQREPERVWLALAVRAYVPMLVAMRTRFRRLDRDERDQILYASLVEALHRFPLDRCTRRRSWRLRRDTETFARRAARKCRLRSGVSLEGDPAGSCALASHNPHELAERIRERVAPDVVRPRDLDVLIDTCVFGWSLHELAKAEAINDNDVGRAYQRLKKRRLKAARQLRERISIFSFPELAPWVPSLLVPANEAGRIGQGVSE